MFKHPLAGGKKVRKKLRGRQEQIFSHIPVDGKWLARVALRLIALRAGFKGSDKNYTATLYELREQGDIEISQDGGRVRRTQMWLFE